ncbi:MAG: hypothetical protein COA47_11470 [Robiginitomaculum sp.]|nr:MAG: hypothetical protein COA47_11470 [Robiginitomaculum sp.]
MSNNRKLPDSAGIGLKPIHYEDAMHCAEPGLWFEIHPENYMVAGGPRLSWLEAFAQKFPMSFHGVGLSLGGPDRPDPEHLKRLKRLTDQFDPVQVSEHLAWSRLGDTYFADLLPPPVSADALDRVVAHIDETQEVLGRTLLIENPSLYLPLPGIEDLPEMYVEAAKRTGAGLLFDLNNIIVCEANVDLSAEVWLDAVPGHLVGEIHIAGATPRQIGDETILIDSHDAPVGEPVWEMLARVRKLYGPKPVLIERDDNIPSFAELMAERNRAEQVLRQPEREMLHAG